MNEYLALWKNYTNFSACTSRRGYWMAYLFNFIILMIFSLLAGRSSIFSTLTSLYSLAIFIPGLAISVRRLRDAGYRWTWIFIVLVPIIGFIVFLVLLCKPTVYTGIEQV